jgi:hypothetical protein
MKYLMGCGHVSNATDEDDNPICVICSGIVSGATVVIKECSGNAGLEGRKAKCLYCKKTVDSNWGLMLFGYMPEGEYDNYYCGCRGYD